MVASAGLLLFGALGGALAPWHREPQREPPTASSLPLGLSAAELDELAREAEALVAGEDDEQGQTPENDDGSVTRPDPLARGQFWLREAERLRRTGRIREAVAALDQARALLPRTPVPCLKAARLLLSLENPDELRRFAACARERAPHLAAPYLYEGVALQLLGDERGAAKSYKTFARLAPQSARAWESRLVARRLVVDAPGSPEPRPPPVNP